MGVDPEVLEKSGKLCKGVELEKWSWRRRVGKRSFHVKKHREGVCPGPGGFSRI